MPIDTPARQGPPAGVVISGLGLVTAVGRSVEASCASLRAGILRVRDIDSCAVDGGGGETAPLQGHPIGEFPDGFQQFGRWVRTGYDCIRDLQRNAALPPGANAMFWKRTGLIALVPILDIGRFLWTLEMAPGALWNFYLDPLLGLLELPVAAEHRRVVPEGHAGLGEALRIAGDDLARGRLDRVLILGVDSYLDDLTLDWLMRADRLKTGDHATGVLPGEAGACVLLERGDASASRRAASQARLLAFASRVPRDGRQSVPDEDPAAVRDRDVPALGRVLAGAVGDALDAVPGARPFRGDVVLDLNGENWRSTVWGYAQIHLNDALDFAACREVLPAVSFGEIGAASGPAGLCVAARSWARGYARGDRALVCCVSDSGAVGAALLGAPAQDAPGLVSSRVGHA